MGAHKSPIVVELRLDETTLFKRMQERRSPWDVDKIADGIGGPAWVRFLSAEGCSYEWPSDWDILRLDGAQDPDIVADSVFAFLVPRLSDPGALVLVVGDGATGKSTLLRKLVERRLPATPLVADWIKDPIKTLDLAGWPGRRDEVYTQLYFLIANLIASGQSVILENPFKVEMAQARTHLYSLLEYLCTGAADLRDIFRLFEPLRGLK